MSDPVASSSFGWEPNGEGAGTRRIHGSKEYSKQDFDQVWQALDSDEPAPCQACGQPIRIDYHEGKELWRRAWPTIRCEKGCTLIENTFHLNLWPDV